MEHQFPESFLELHQRGWMQVPDEALESAVTEFDLARPGSDFLWFPDVNWLTIDECRQYDFLPGQRKDLLPFARTGGGSLWAWITDAHQLGPVVLCPNDESNGTYIAPDFEGVLFRWAVEFATSVVLMPGAERRGKYAIDDFAPEEVRQVLQGWVDKVGRWLRPGWVSVLEGIRTREFKPLHPEGPPDGFDDYHSLLPEEEARHLIKQELQFDALDQTFLWWEYSDE